MTGFPEWETDDQALVEETAAFAGDFLNAIDYEPEAGFDVFADGEIFLDGAKTGFFLKAPFLSDPSSEDTGGIRGYVIEADEFSVGGLEDVFLFLITQGGDGTCIAGSGECPGVAKGLAENEHDFRGGLELAFCPEGDVVIVFLFGQAEVFVERQGGAGFRACAVFGKPLGVLAGCGFYFGEVFLDFLGRDHDADASFDRNFLFEEPFEDFRNLRGEDG